MCICRITKQTQISNVTLNDLTTFSYNFFSLYCIALWDAFLSWSAFLTSSLWSCVRFALWDSIDYWLDVLASSNYSCVDWPYMMPSSSEELSYLPSFDLLLDLPSGMTSSPDQLSYLPPFDPMISGFLMLLFPATIIGAYFFKWGNLSNNLLTFSSNFFSW